MKHEYIHLDKSSVLVSTPKGLTRAFCPIPAICIRDTENGICIGDKVKVTAILFSKKYPLLYEVNGSEIPYHHFKLTF